MDRSGHIKSDHVLTPETRKLLRELGHGKNGSSSKRAQEKKKTLPELTQETRNVLLEPAQETKKV